MSVPHHLHDNKWSSRLHISMHHQHKPFRMPSPPLQHTTPCCQAGYVRAPTRPHPLSPLSQSGRGRGRLTRCKVITNSPKGASPPHLQRKRWQSCVATTKTKREGLLLLPASSSLHSLVNAALQRLQRRRRRRLSARPTPSHQATAFRRASLRSPILAPTSVSAGDPSL